MSIFFINSDAKDNKGRSDHEKWILRCLAVTSGSIRYKKALQRINPGDTLLLYVNSTGVCAIGVAVDDLVSEVKDKSDMINPAEEIEYHRCVTWDLDVSENPISRKKIIEICGQGPTNGVQVIKNRDSESIFLSLINKLACAPTADYSHFIARSERLFKQGINSRPIGFEKPKKFYGTTNTYYRDPCVRAWVIKRANGECELCGKKSFKTDSDDWFLESHHLIPLHDNGPDTPENTAGLCANCHRELHYGRERKAKTCALQARIVSKERKIL